MKKMKPKRASIYALVILAVGAIIALVGIDFLEDTPAICGIGFLIMASSLIFRAMFCRCPHCDHLLNPMDGDFCPHCGKKINE